MQNNMKKILITGGNSRFAKNLNKFGKGYTLIFRDKKQLDITNSQSIKKNLIKYKPDYVLHLAGLSRPMKIHKTNLTKSITLNIVGTCNIVKACFEKNIKLIYLSTNYVYQGVKGNYKESDPVLPWNNYGWSKLGGESAVQMYSNSLILRISMTEKPFLHKRAYANVLANFAYQENIAKILLKLINKKGVINVGGKTQSIYSFAKKDNKLIKKKYSKGEFPLKLDMSLNKFKKIVILK